MYFLPSDSGSIKHSAPRASVTIDQIRSQPKKFGRRMLLNPYEINRQYKDIALR